MKARKKMPNSVSDGKTVRLTGNGPYHGYPIRLSIALIVKNEEKTLDRCLSSLQPLRDAVESELIITDTGSTDRTVEIARKYTDHIIPFEWCGDFSAARNTGVEAARGEWFLFLDADEWFENTDELIEFFNNGECERYGSGAYIVRNYGDYSGKAFSDFKALRLTRMYPGFHFDHIVHEDFARLTPTKVFGAYVHHYGYVFQTEEERQKKHGRNVELLEKALEQDPEDLKMYYQLSREYFMTKETDMVRKYGELGLEKERKHPDPMRRLTFYYNIIESLFIDSQFGDVMRRVDEVTRETPEENIFWLDFDYYAQVSALQQQEYERAVSYGEDYLRIWNKRESGELDPDMEIAMDFSYINTRSWEQVLLRTLEANLKLERYLPAKETLEALPFSEKDSFQTLPGLVCEYCSKTGDWEALSAFYRAGLSIQGRIYHTMLVGLLEVSLSGEPEKKRAAASSALAALEDDGDAYIRLCRLRASEAGENREAVMRELDWFSQWNGEWMPLFSDVVFFGMREKIGLTAFFRNIETEEIGSYVSDIWKRHSDFEKIAQDYPDSVSFDGIRGLCWAICIRESIILRESPEEREDDKIRRFEAYAGDFARYVRMLYLPELLSPERVSVLPRAHRFGYYMGCAFSAQNRGDGVSYLSNLRLALHSYPVMERQISILLERFERQNREEQAKVEEFRSLAGQVKKNIRVLIAQGRLEEAGRFTMQLARLMPNDPEIVEFRSLTHTEPDLNELAARLPQ